MKSILGWVAVFGIAVLIYSKYQSSKKDKLNVTIK